MVRQLKMFSRIATMHFICLARKIRGEDQEDYLCRGDEPKMSQSGNVFRGIVPNLKD